MIASIPVAIAHGDTAPAQVSGVRLGTRNRSAAPVDLRLFRPQGTRIAVLAGAVPVQLLALRAATVGAVIRVQSPRPQAWGPVIRHGADVSIAPAGAGLPPPGTPDAPVLIVDDRPAEAGSLGEAGPWQCRLDLRTLATTSDLGALGRAELMVFGPVRSGVAAALASMTGLPLSHLGRLGSLGPGTVALVWPGGIHYVDLDPSDAEQRVLAQSSR
jgi:hypothetical protein